MHKELRVKEPARRFLLVPSSLERLANIYLEQPLHQFIREEKLLKSAELLETTDARSTRSSLQGAPEHKIPLKRPHEKKSWK